MRMRGVPFLLVCALLSGAARPPVQGTGFTCLAANGAELRINIDLKAKRYQEAGKSPKKIEKIEDAAITLLHYSTVEDGMYLDHRLDRSTLILSTSIVDGEGRLLSTDYQCRMGPPFNFASERKF